MYVVTYVLYRKLYRIRRTERTSVMTMSRRRMGIIKSRIKMATGGLGCEAGAGGGACAGVILL